MDSDAPDWSDEPDRTTIEVPVLATTALPTDSRRYEQLLVVVGNEPGRTAPIGTQLTIGRDPDCEFALTESSVSRRHVRLSRRGTSLWIEDLGSRNGTLVNGRPVRSGPLAIGDRIQLGSKVVLLVTHDDPLKSILRERQKMEAVGRLAAGVAHDFNNVAAAALATSDHLEELLDSRGVLGDAEVAECMRDLRAALERGADLTRSLASLGRRKPAGPAEPVDLAEVCEEVARLCERTFGQKYEIRRRWRGKLYVRAHRTELHQVLVNLCLNARDAMPEGGTLRIAAEHGSGTHFGSGRTEWILLRVADSGSGMSEAVRARIFEPFFTTKREGHGSGLGLATVEEIVRANGGRIEVESAPGRGTVFLVWLPANAPAEEIVSSPRASRVDAPEREATHVLVVDDEDMVLRSIVRLLRSAGHHVLTASDGAEAIRVFEGASPRPSVVLLDLDLPVMSGDDALRRLLEIEPTVRVITVSGHWDPDRRAALLAAGAVSFLAKPFDARELRATVAAAARRRNER